MITPTIKSKNGRYLWVYKYGLQSNDQYRRVLFWLLNLLLLFSIEKKMVQINVLAFCLASFFVLNFVNCGDENGVSSSEIKSVDFVAVEDIDQFLLENPNAQMLEKVANVSNTKNQIIYRFGHRISGMLNIFRKKFIRNNMYQNA